MLDASCDTQQKNCPRRVPSLLFRIALSVCLSLCPFCSWLGTPPCSLRYLYLALSLSLTLSLSPSLLTCLRHIACDVATPKTLGATRATSRSVSTRQCHMQANKILIKSASSLLLASHELPKLHGGKNATCKAASLNT